MESEQDRLIGEFVDLLGNIKKAVDKTTMTEDTEVKYPDIIFNMPDESEPDGNAYVILGRMSKALRKGGATKEEVAQFTDEATSGNYDELRATCAKWVNIE